MKVILSPNPYRDKGLRAVREARRILEQDGVETAVCLPFRPDGGCELPEDIRFEALQNAARGADLLICFGGDGTILHSAKLAAEYHFPILGVNMGSVGFMAELEHGELKLLHRLVKGEYTLERRAMMDVRVFRDKRVIHRELALNDATITKGAVARVIDLAVYGDRVKIMEFSGDGVIVATPTGSTAYSMSAGGPIVEPTADNLIITPICAHALQAKSFVLGPERVIAVRANRQSRKTAYLSVDGGKAFRLGSGDIVELCNGGEHIELVRLSGRNFYEIISQKLGGN
ncbi:MAG: NAD(+)/NADH kinase [Clostridiales bacterium]|nr:NAD(+)/NADH kinase [Clostridiales bacterium]